MKVSEYYVINIRNSEQINTIKDFEEELFRQKKIFVTIPLGEELSNYVTLLDIPIEIYPEFRNEKDLKNLLFYVLLNQSLIF